MPYPHQSLVEKSGLRWGWVYVASYVWCLNCLLSNHANTWSHQTTTIIWKKNLENTEPQNRWLKEAKSCKCLALATPAGNGNEFKPGRTQNSGQEGPGSPFRTPVSFWNCVLFSWAFLWKKNCRNRESLGPLRFKKQKREIHLLAWRPSSWIKCCFRALDLKKEKENLRNLGLLFQLWADPRNLETRCGSPEAVWTRCCVRFRVEMTEDHGMLRDIGHFSVPKIHFQCHFGNWRVVWASSQISWLESLAIYESFCCGIWERPWNWGKLSGGELILKLTFPNSGHQALLTSRIIFESWISLQVDAKFLEALDLYRSVKYGVKCLVWKW